MKIDSNARFLNHSLITFQLSFPIFQSLAWQITKLSKILFPSLNFALTIFIFDMQAFHFHALVSLSHLHHLQFSSKVIRIRAVQQKISEAEVKCNWYEGLWKAVMKSLVKLRYPILIYEVQATSTFYALVGVVDCTCVKIQ